MLETGLVGDSSELEWRSDPMLTILDTATRFIFSKWGVLGGGGMLLLSLGKITANDYTTILGVLVLDRLFRIARIPPTSGSRIRLSRVLFNSHNSNPQRPSGMRAVERSSPLRQRSRRPPNNKSQTPRKRRRQPGS